MKIEFSRYPSESDEDFAFRIRKASKGLGLKLLRPTAQDPDNTVVGVLLRKRETDNGTRYEYETDTK